MDKQRNAAVVIGDRDLKTDVKNKRRRERGLEEAEEPDYLTFTSQAEHELQRGQPEVALQYLNTALKLEPDDEMCLGNFIHSR